MAWAVYLLVGSVLGVTCSVSAQGTNATGNGSRPLLVGALEYPVFMSKREDGTFEGFLIDLMTELSDHAGFDFIIKEPADMRWGRRLEDGTWTGMVGELVRGELDMALGLLIASPREAVIDFSAVVLDEGLEMLVKKPETTRKEWWRDIMTIPVWLLVIGSFLLAAIVMFVIIRVSPYENRAYSAEVGEASRLSTFGHSLWICYSAMSWQGVDYSPRSVSGRFLFVFWFGFIVWTLILITGAIAGLFVASPAAFPVVPIESFDDLAATDDIRPAFIRGGVAERFFKNSPFPSFQRLHQKAILVNSMDEGVKLARRGGVAFITESAKSRFYSNRKPCDLMAIHDGSIVTTRHQAIGLPVDSPFREVVNIALLQLRESGRLHVLYRKWVATGECAQPDSFAKTRPASFQRLTSWDLMPMFIALIVAAILALCIMGIEVKWDKRTAKQPDAASSGKSAGPRDDDTKV